jgi:hypothetical protein
MTFLNEVQEKQRRLQKDVKTIMQALQEYRPKPKGKTVGLIIPEPCREHLKAQMEVWGADSYRQIVNTCVVLGLERLEEIGKMRGKPEPKKTRPRAARPSARVKKLLDLREETYDAGGETNPEDESVVEEVQEVLGPDDSGDDGIPTPERGEEDVPCGPGILVDSQGGDGR